MRTENYDRPFEEFYSNSDNWGKEKSERPWRWEIEIEEEKALAVRQETTNA